MKNPDWTDVHDNNVLNPLFHSLALFYPCNSAAFCCGSVFDNASKLLLPQHRTKKKPTLTDSREEKISIALRFHSSILSLGLKRTLDILEVLRVRRQRLTLPNDERRFLRNTCDVRKTKASSEAPQRWERKTMVGGEQGTLFEKVCHHLICHLPGHGAHHANTKTRANTQCEPARGWTVGRTCVPLFKWNKKKSNSKFHI